MKTHRLHNSSLCGLTQILALAAGLSLAGCGKQSPNGDPGISKPGRSNTPPDIQTNASPTQPQGIGTNPVPAVSHGGNVKQKEPVNPKAVVQPATPPGIATNPAVPIGL